MRMTQCTSRDVAILEIADEFTYGSREEFTSTMDKAKQSSSRHLIPNFKQVTFVNSRAIGLLVLAAQHFKADNRKLSLLAPQGTIKQISELANITNMLGVFPSEEAATSGKAA